jgi:hypothetical protein
MKLFALETLADGGEGAFCFTNKLPKGIGPATYRLADGVSLHERFPGGIPEMSWALGDDYPGLALPSFLGNTGGFLAVHRDAAKIIESHRCGDLEVLPFTLLNHRGRVHSRDYVLLNPLGGVDCLDLAASVISRARSGKILGIDTIVLSSEKLRDPRDLFRIQEDPSCYVLSERLVGALSAAGCTNFVTAPLEQR